MKLAEGYKTFTKVYIQTKQNSEMYELEFYCGITLNII